MPLIFQKDHQEFGCKIAVWENTEDDDFFMERLVLNDDEDAYLNSLNENRRQEWMCSRVVLKILLDADYIPLRKDDFGKPIIEHSPYHISISHSNNRAAIIASKKLVGIDIQEDVAKIDRIHSKFISEKELDKLDSEKTHESYHIYWGAKEAMYKAYGKKQLNFREHMFLHSFKYFNPQLELKGRVHKNGIKQDYNIFSEEIDNYYLVYAVLD